MTSLRNAKEIISDELMIAVILKGLPDSFKLFAINISQSSTDTTWSEFKTKLRSYEETENLNNTKSDNIVSIKDTKTESQRCYSCGQKGHFDRSCQQDQSKQQQNASKTAMKWCHYHKNTRGYCFSPTKNRAVISWKSKKQTTVALSSCRQNTWAWGVLTQEGLYLNQLLQHMDDENNFTC